MLSVWPCMYVGVCICVCTWQQWMLSLAAGWTGGMDHPTGCWIQPSSLTPAFSSRFAEAFAGASAMVRALGGLTGQTKGQVL